MAKKVLVTGANGHSGLFQVKRLLELGYEVVATDLKPLDREKVMSKETVFGTKLNYNDMVARNYENPKVTFIPANLTDKASLNALWDDPKVKGVQYDAIYHPASLYDYFATLDILMKINVGGTQNLLEVICEKQKGNLPRFIHWSTAGVYGEPDYEIKKDENGKLVKLPVDETAPYNPPNWYSTSKMFQEFVVYDFWKNHSVPMTILRPIVIAGPGQLYGVWHIFYLLSRLGMVTLPIISPTVHQTHINLCHVEDLANAAIFCAENEKTAGEAYNVGSLSTTQWQFLDYLASILDVMTITVPVPFKVYGLAAANIRTWVAKETLKARKWGLRPLIDYPMTEYITHDYFFLNTKLRDLGFEYKFPTVFDVCRDSVRWYKDHGWFD